MIGLIDCNNFFASCERVFNPNLDGKPIVVLSNNDGAIIARSEEAKRLAVKMGAPFYQIKDLISNIISMYSLQIIHFMEIYRGSDVHFGRPSSRN